MRNKLIIAEHRGGILTTGNHRRLMLWAIFCVERVLSHYPTHPDTDAQLLKAITIAKKWADGKCSSMDAIRASREVHGLAKSMDDKIACLAARAVGQAVATAHMADHCVGAALYAQKIIKSSGGSIQAEKEIQIQALRDLPPELSTLIIELMETKAKGFGI